MSAWIITIGDEILVGRILNWNAYWLAKRLTSLGVQVKKIVCVPDDIDVISKTIIDAINDKVDFIFTTGGLGPTPGDVTTEAICKATGRELILNSKALEFIRKRYDELYRLGLVDSPQINEARKKMAKTPEGADVIYNDVGVAPAIILDTDLATIIALPGVPSEAMYLFEKIVPRIRTRKKVAVVEDYIDVEDESALAKILSEIRREYPDVSIKTYPIGYGQKRMRIVAIAEDLKKAEAALKTFINRIRKD